MKYKMASEKNVEVLFKCNRKRCNDCSYPTCKHTSRFDFEENKILNVNDDVLLNKNIFNKMGDLFFEK